MLSILLCGVRVLCSSTVMIVYPFSDDSQDVEKLTFHMHCGSHAAVINGQRTAHRPK